MPRVFLQTPVTRMPTHRGWYSLVKEEDGFPHRNFFDGRKWNDDLVIEMYDYWLRPIVIDDKTYEILDKKLNLPLTNMEKFQFYYFVKGSDCPFTKNIEAVDLFEAKTKYEQWKGEQPGEITEKPHLPPKQIS